METTGHAADAAHGALGRRTGGVLCLLLGALLLAGCSSRRAGADDGSIEASTLGGLGVPLNAVPRPGKCRIWRPGNPPSQQSGQGACRTLSRRVAGGAWLLRHPTPPEGGPDRVHLVVYGEDGPSLVRIFDRGTGKMVRERRPE
jgi:hypothetical protein